jgi:voltage-gated potassium channel
VGLVVAGCAAPPPAPRTALGRALAVALVVLVSALAAGPIGIVVAEVRRAARACARCGAGAHGTDAAYCRHCGARLAGRAAITDAGRPTA